METIYFINRVLGLLFLICYSYQIFYILVTLVKKRRPHRTENIIYHNFAVMISARNEETVIGELIDSIKNQTYPTDKVTVFIVADNCTDNTALIARDSGAVVYERNDKYKIGKGYALDFLLKHINEDYARDAFDAFFVFDADNILAPTYIEEMNKTYCDGYKAMTSYRNSKNFGDNWISAGYALWFLRESKYLNNSRMILGSSCAISGTGFMIDRSFLEDENGNKGWHYFLLTEDIEFTASNIVDGKIIGYCGDAVLYDEQPTKFRQSWDQRLRWAKGYLQVYKNYGLGLIKGMLRYRHDENETKIKRRKASRFSCFDMTMTIMPAMILSGVLFVFDIIVGIILLLVYRDYQNAITLLMLPTIDASMLTFFIGLVTTITEWKQIHTSTAKKILYMFTFPIFMLTYIPIALTAVVSRKVEWKPIKHTKKVSLGDIHADGGKKDDTL